MREDRVALIVSIVAIFIVWGLFSQFGLLRYLGWLQ